MINGRSPILIQSSILSLSTDRRCSPRNLWLNYVAIPMSQDYSGGLPRRMPLAVMSPRGGSIVVCLTITPAAHYPHFMNLINIYSNEENLIIDCCGNDEHCHICKEGHPGR